jgi:hypothetical protein
MLQFLKVQNNTKTHICLMMLHINTF